MFHDLFAEPDISGSLEIFAAQRSGKPAARISLLQRGYFPKPSVANSSHQRKLITGQLFLSAWLFNVGSGSTATGWTFIWLIPVR